MTRSRDYDSNSVFLFFSFFQFCLSEIQKQKIEISECAACGPGRLSDEPRGWALVHRFQGVCLTLWRNAVIFFLVLDSGPGSWCCQVNEVLWNLVPLLKLISIPLKRAWSYGWPFGDGKNIGELSLDRWHTLVGRRCSDGEDCQRSGSEGKECRGRVVLGSDSVFKFGSSEMEPEKSWTNTRLFSWSLLGLYVITSFKQECC